MPRTKRVIKTPITENSEAEGNGDSVKVGKKVLATGSTKGHRQEKMATATFPLVDSPEKPAEMPKSRGKKKTVAAKEVLTETNVIVKFPKVKGVRKIVPLSVIPKEKGDMEPEKTKKPASKGRKKKEAPVEAVLEVNEHVENACTEAEPVKTKGRGKKGLTSDLTVTEQISPIKEVKIKTKGSVKGRKKEKEVPDAVNQELSVIDDENVGKSDTPKNATSVCSDKENDDDVEAKIETAPEPIKQKTSKISKKGKSVKKSLKEI